MQHEKNETTKPSKKTPEAFDQSNGLTRGLIVFFPNFAELCS